MILGFHNIRSNMKNLNPTIKHSYYVTGIKICHTVKKCVLGNIIMSEKKNMLRNASVTWPRPHTTSQFLLWILLKFRKSREKFLML